MPFVVAPRNLNIGHADDDGFRSQEFWKTGPLGPPTPTIPSSLTGGCGIDPCGQCECGTPKSDIEPRFVFSRPLDGQRNVPLTQVLKFTTYCYSSWIEIPDSVVEISEDGGLTFEIAFNGFVDPDSFYAPYDGPHSKVRRTQGHELTFYIQKNGNWPIAQKCYVRYTGNDEFGQQATKTNALVWI
jgi:hypothetical protein